MSTNREQYHEVYSPKRARIYGIMLKSTDYQSRLDALKRDAQAEEEEAEGLISAYFAAERHAKLPGGIQALPDLDEKCKPGMLPEIPEGITDFIELYMTAQAYGGSPHVLLDEGYNKLGNSNLQTKRLLEHFNLRGNIADYYDHLTKHVRGENPLSNFYRRQQQDHLLYPIDPAQL